MAISESQKRSIFKAITYRFLGASVGALIALILTGRFDLAVIFGALDIVIKIGAYYFHERIWDRINYGRVKQSDYEI